MFITNYDLLYHHPRLCHRYRHLSTTPTITTTTFLPPPPLSLLLPPTHLSPLPPIYHRYAFYYHPSIINLKEPRTCLDMWWGDRDGSVWKRERGGRGDIRRVQQHGSEEGGWGQLNTTTTNTNTGIIYQRHYHHHHYWHWHHHNYHSIILPAAATLSPSQPPAHGEYFFSTCRNDAS